MAHRSKSKDPGSKQAPRTVASRPRARGAAAARQPLPLTEDDVYLFSEGTHQQIWRHLGAHPLPSERQATRFAVWAPNAEAVSVMGGFNGWNKQSHRLEPVGSSGIWQGTIEGIGRGEPYKYHIVSRHHGYAVDKRDPVAFYGEVPPGTASIVWDLEYEWHDREWMDERRERNALDAPLSIYEVHAGSWRRFGRDRLPTYRELAEPLAEYCKRMGFTHVEFMPLAEHPFYGSWGYQTTSYFAPSARYGTPQDLMHLVDVLHQNGIGVILDWVPSHFPTDEHGLGYFDGTHLYEHADPRKGFHPDWKSFIFNYGRNEVRSFLVSNALFWLETYHLDGLRVDAVASMLYLDYSRREGEWIPNEHGGRENIEAIEFLRYLNRRVYEHHPDVQTIAEESTAWPMVSRPIEMGGLGFGLKWDMGWMHDTLLYMSREPIYRRYHHHDLTFRLVYAFYENFVLPLSHDEVVYGKGSLIGKMPGDPWQRFANLRLLFAYMYASAGKKLLFMGGEFAQEREWTHEGELDWGRSDAPANAGVQRLVADLNQVYRSESALHQLDCDPSGFEWVVADDHGQSVLCFLRKDREGRPLLAAFNFTPIPRHNYRIGVPRGGTWREVLNSDARAYGGSGQGNLGSVEASPTGSHGRPFSLNLVLPPLGAVYLSPVP